MVMTKEKLIAQQCNLAGRKEESHSTVPTEISGVQAGDGNNTTFLELGLSLSFELEILTKTKIRSKYKARASRVISICMTKREASYKLQKQCHDRREMT